MVAVYIRLSDEDKDKAQSEESKSIQNQRQLLMSYAASKNWIIYNIYSDDDYSGLDKNRPAFLQMLTDAKAGRFNIILCKSQSRFSRDMEVIEKYINNRFLEWGIRFVSVVDNVDTNVAGNKKARQIYALVNEWYSEDLSESIRAVFKDKMKKGEYLGSFACYGYVKDPKCQSRLMIDPYAAKIVRMIFELYISGMGVSEICRFLEEKQILIPTKYKILIGQKYTNPNSQKNKWSRGTVLKILKNRVYTGDLVQGVIKKANFKSAKRIRCPQEEWVIAKNTHEAIVSKDIFKKAQDKLERFHSKGKGSLKP